MDCIKFELSGQGATFKKPHTNYRNLTYPHIHKLALLGILGAVSGYKGHGEKKKEDKYPEFYEKLRGLKVAIVPKYKNFYITMKDVTDTNGTSNKGSTFIIKEQEINQPHWTIYLAQGRVKDSVYSHLKDMILREKAVFPPYLGKNHFHATIDNIEILELKKNEDYFGKVASLIKSKDCKIVDDYGIEESTETIIHYYPINFRSYENYYVEEKFYLTDSQLEWEPTKSIYRHGNRNLYFF